MSQEPQKSKLIREFFKITVCINFRGFKLVAELWHVIISVNSGSFVCFQCVQLSLWNYVNSIFFSNGGFIYIFKHHLLPFSCCLHIYSYCLVCLRYLSTGKTIWAGGSEGKSKQSTTKAHWHLSWNATSFLYTHMYANAHGNQCGRIRCGHPYAHHSWVPRDNWLYFTLHFSHVSPVIRQ